ncbi:putative gustatory receptor 85a [Drosophila subpulchrella]|uniref:putative gustatory receptor 85a n=1 Tax=Drosophila subpulchrella TaxID=1486046 RepID=UPI0018A17AB2|nr:putative gustatory receptor 85a [Drosophila subpulchrella]
MTIQKFVNRQAAGVFHIVSDAKRRLVQLGLSSFCALNGILDFYMDNGSKRLRWSRWLAIYRIVHNFVVFSLTTRFLLDFWKQHEAEINNSLLMTMNFFPYFTLVFLAIISSMGCCFYWQNRIFVVLQKLRHQREQSRQLGYRVPKGKQLYVDCLMFLITVLLILRLSIHVTVWLISVRVGFNHPCNCFLPECMTFAMNYLVFATLAEISQCWWRLQSGLEMILLDHPKPRTVANQLCHIQRLHSMFQCLIDVTSEVCSIFKFVLLTYLIRNLWSGIVTGYMVIRLVLGKGHGDVELSYIVLAFIICIQPLMFSILMNSMTHTTDSLLDVTKDILRTPHKQSAQVERSIEWLSLQLAGQHTYIAVFGTFRMNRSLLFTSTSVILIHVLYMVQSDYISMTM